MLAHLPHSLEGGPQLLVELFCIAFAVLCATLEDCRFNIASHQFNSDIPDLTRIRVSLILCFWHQMQEPSLRQQASADVL